jgi:hypothetical protein
MTATIGPTRRAAPFGFFLRGESAARFTGGRVTISAPEDAAPPGAPPLIGSGMMERERA